MFQSCKIVVLSVAFFTSIFCAGGNVLFAVIPERSYFGESEMIKCEWLSILDNDIEKNKKFEKYRKYKDSMATQSDCDCVKKFVRLFVSSLYKNLSDSDWWYTNVHNLNLSRLNSHFLYFLYCNKAQVANLRQYIDNDVEILTDFLLKQMPSSDKSIQNASYLKEAIRRAFAEKKISLKGLSALFSSSWIKYAMTKCKNHFSVLKIFSEEGGFFCGKFADAFQKLFIEKDWCFRGRCILFYFCGYAPSSNIEVAYGLQAFRITKKRKEFQTFSEEELSELSRRITCILKKRNIMLHTILMTVPPENVEKVEEAEEFFYLMTEKMEDVRDDADSLVEQRFSDSQYWKVEKHLATTKQKRSLMNSKERKKRQWNTTIKS